MKENLRSSVHGVNMKAPTAGLSHVSRKSVADTERMVKLEYMVSQLGK